MTEANASAAEPSAAQDTVQEQTAIAAETPAPEQPPAEANVDDKPNAASEPSQEPSAADAKQADDIPAADKGTQTAEAEPTDAEKGFWPDGWRDEIVKIAGGDEKLRKRMDRYASPADVLKALRAVESKQRELKKPLPENPTDKELEEWRKDNGIPLKPEEYDTNLPDGLVIGEADKPRIGKFLTAMHQANASPASVTAALSAYYQLVEDEQASLREADIDYKQISEDELRSEWGAEFRRNVNLANGLLETAPAGLKDRILGARLADGRKLGDDPAALRFLTSLAREINPISTVLPGTAANSTGLTDEINRLETMMRDPASEYWRGPNADANQTKYRELLNMRDRVAKRAA